MTERSGQMAFVRQTHIFLSVIFLSDLCLVVAQPLQDLRASARDFRVVQYDLVQRRGVDAPIRILKQKSFQMNGQNAAALWNKLSRDARVQVCARFAHELTIQARDTYEPGTNELRDPARLRRLNEIQHHVAAFLLQLLVDRGGSIPDDYLVTTFGDGNGDLQPALSWCLSRALLH